MSRLNRTACRVIPYCFPHSVLTRSTTSPTTRLSASRSLAYETKTSRGFPDPNTWRELFTAADPAMLTSSLGSSESLRKLSRCSVQALVVNPFSAGGPSEKRLSPRDVKEESLGHFLLSARR